MSFRRILCLTLCGFVAASSWAAQDPPRVKGKPVGPPAKKGRFGGRAGEINTPPARGERHPDKLKVGDPAPDFTLADPTGKQQITLSSFRDKKPVVLIFGSFT